MSPELSRKIAQLTQYLSPADQITIMSLSQSGKLNNWSDVPKEIIERGKAEGFRN